MCIFILCVFIYVLYAQIPKRHVLDLKFFLTYCTLVDMARLLYPSDAPAVLKTLETIIRLWYANVVRMSI